MAKDIRKVQVCFNLLDPEQRMMFDKVNSYPNKSAYIKRVLLKDMLSVPVPQIVQQMPSVAVSMDIAVDDFI